MVCLQTKKDPSKRAKAATAAEFEDVMTTFMQKADEVAADHKNVFSSDRGPIFSFDNAPIHQGANLKGLKLDGARRAPLSPSSPDMHKCIEHVFGTIERAMQDCIRRDPGLSTAAKYKAKLEELFTTRITPEGVRKDVESLKPTYRAIQDAGGDWPDRRFR